MSMKLIATTTVGSGGAADIEFTSIPGTYTDLYLLVNLRSTRNAKADYLDVIFNGSTSNYTGRALYGTGTTTQSFTETVYAGEINGDTTTSNTFGNGLVYIPNYAGATNKSYSTDTVTEHNGGSSFDAVQIIMAKLWSDTSAITSVKIAGRFGNLMQHSTASLYGITKGSDGTTTVS